MILYLEATMARLRVDEAYFFRISYNWKFQKVMDVSQDVSSYKAFRIVPVYVREYIKHLQTLDTQ